MREIMGKDENRRQTFRYRETRDKEKENRMNNIVWMQCMDCAARRSWPYGKCEGCRYNIMHMTNDTDKAEEIYISQMAVKDAGDKAHRELEKQQTEDIKFGFKLLLYFVLGCYGSLILLALIFGIS